MSKLDTEVESQHLNSLSEEAKAAYLAGKYHFRNEKPKLINGTLSKLARITISGKTQVEQYNDIYYKIKDLITGHKTTPILHCLICGTQHKCSYNSNGQIQMSNFMQHIKQKHPYELTIDDQLRLRDTPTNSLTIASWNKPQQQQPEEESASIKKKITETIAIMCASKGNIPINIVDNESFRDAIRSIICIFKPNQKLFFPSRWTITRKILYITDKADQEEREDFRNLMKKRKIPLFPITNDSTTSLAKIPYSCVTASLIIRPGNGQPWKLKEYFINCCPNEAKSHTREANTDHLLSTLKAYCSTDQNNSVLMGTDQNSNELTKLISSGTFDCGSNTPFEILKDLGVITIKCMDHRLNTYLDHMNKDKVYKLAFESIYFVMDTIRTSSINTTELKRIQKEKDVKHPVGCINGAATRWTYDTRTIRRGNRLYEFILLMDIKNMYFRNPAKRTIYANNLKLWQSDGVHYIRFILPILERIEFWILFFESGRTITISFCSYAVDDLYMFLNYLIDDINKENVKVPCPFPNEIVYNNILYILKKFQNELMIVFCHVNNDISLRVAEILDFRIALPIKERFNMRGEEFLKIVPILMKFYDESLLAKTLFQCKESVVDVVDDNTDQNTNEESNFDPWHILQSPASASDCPVNAVVKLRSDFEKECYSYVSYLRDDNNSFLNDKKYDMLNRDPLIQQWPHIEDRFPMLSQLASYILECPASIAGSERFFSRLTNIITKHRSSLDKNLASRLIVHSMRCRHNILSQRCSIKIPPFGKAIPNEKIINTSS
jgi:hypothetical protein